MTCRSRIRELKPRVEPPKDRAVFWMTDDCGGKYELGVIAKGKPSWATHWTEPPTIAGGAYVVHSLEAQELPAEFARVLLYLEPHRDYPYVGYWDGENWMVDRYATGDAVCVPRGWRPLPDDEPGDAELLEAARKWAKTWCSVGHGESHTENCRALDAIVQKRSGK